MEETLRAGFWRRFAAYLIDGLAINIMLTVNLYGLFCMGTVIDKSLLARILSLFFQLIQSAMLFAYAIFSVAYFGATPGKLLLGLRVVLPGSNRKCGIGFWRAPSEKHFISHISLAAWAGVFMGGLGQK